MFEVQHPVLAIRGLNIQHSMCNEEQEEQPVERAVRGLRTKDHG